MALRVLILVNQHKEDAIQASKSVGQAVNKYAKLLDTQNAINPQQLPEPDDIDLIIALGGDGTILRAAHHSLMLNCPLLGVNTGRVGFMAGYELDSFLDRAKDILDESNSLSTRLVYPIAAQHLNAQGNMIGELIAFNEFVITAGPPYRIIQIDISIDNNPGPTVDGDGIIVSTPLGSTAYNASAGGPIVSPGVNATTITPNAAHSLSFRPIVVPNESQIRLVARKVNTQDDTGTRLLIDGQQGPCIQAGDHIEITKHSEPVQFIVDPTVSYWSTLVRKMHWAKPPAGRE